MAKARVADAVSHWQKPFDGFQTSALDFYTAVENGLKEREIPNLKMSRVKFKESGVASAERIYLRVKRKGLLFDIGAAPFGTGYFFSWWMAQPRPSWFAGVAFVIAWVLASLWLGITLMPMLQHSEFVQFLLSPLGYKDSRTALPLLMWVLLLWAVHRIARAMQLDVDGLISAVPLVGPVYRWAFVRETYYTVDTMLMYQSLVSGVVTEAIDKLTTAKGLRALTQDEKKPIMRDFLKHAR